jgi:predicted DNA-binding ribbon-helix-helix protein
MAQHGSLGVRDNTLRKRSLVIAGHRTSISLEDDFWEALCEMAAAREISVAALATEVDRCRGGANLSSALRVAVLRHYRAAAFTRV